METSIVKEPYSKISPTAGLTAYHRSFSDIPFASEVAREGKVTEIAGTLLQQTDKITGMFSSVALELRYKAINQALQRGGFNQVLEIACGFSPRGLDIAANGGRYVGTDLPGIGGVVFPVLRKIALREGISPDNLRYQAADALQEEGLKRAAGFFHGRRFAICNEGLLPYLSLEEKRQVATYIRKLLEPGGGSWITPDIAYHELIFEKLGTQKSGNDITDEANKRLERVKDMTGRDFRANYFSNEQEARDFFEEVGFVVEASPIHEGGFALSTLQLLDGGLPEAASALLYAPKIWKLTPRKSSAGDDEK